MSNIKIEGPKKGEYSASGHGMCATGLSPKSAELNLLRNIIAVLETKIVIQDWMPEESKPCPKCKNPRELDEHGALICPCPHCGCEIPF